MMLKLIHEEGSHVDVNHDGRLLFRYTYRSRVDPIESPRPYFHPLCTLNGHAVTDFRPADHRWHQGLSMTFANLSGQNFWGGGTFVDPEQGYVQLENNGQQEHRAWNRLEQHDDRINLEQSLAWVTQGGDTWIDEQRRMRAETIDPGAGYWTLDLGFALTNRSGQPLRFGSPTTAGRHLAGYGSLFWRAPRSFTGGQILASNGREGEVLMGKTSPWIAFIETFDAQDDGATLLFIDDPSNPRYPTQWFVRSQGYPGVSFSFMFDEEYGLAEAETLELRYRIIIADGAWTRAQIESFEE